MKKFLAVALTLVLSLTAVFAVAESMTGAITVISREEGSGTRGAFIELMRVEQKDADGNKIDMTTEEAIITNSTSVVLTSVAGDPAAIGYISLGSLNDTVKALAIDGAEATVENIKAGTYTVSRPFNIVLPTTLSDVASDFVAFILSADGQKVVVDNGYIAVDDAAAAYTASGLYGKLTVGGSSSVTPVMEKLAEAYEALNPDVDVEIQMSDSTTGITGAAEGNFDIGMASRELKDEESATGITSTKIAIDGIAVIVNLENPVANLTKDAVMKIYTGEITDWSGVTE